jgi:23S rRNA pseudouridine1911/1915/1917 synthase
LLLSLPRIHSPGLVHALVSTLAAHIDSIIVDAGGARQRLDRYLAARGQWGSRSHVQQLIADGRVRLDGRSAKAGALLRPGQTIEIEVVAPAAPAGVEAEAIPLEVLYEDHWLLVLNKPPGMVVHPALGHRHGTLVSALLHHWRGTPPGLDPLRPGIVHRLDKDTSGVLVVAKDLDTLADLGAQFRKREVEKQYVACVWGRVRQPSGIVSQPIGRNPVHRKRMAVRAGGRAAVTRFEVVERFDDVTFVRLYPQTGRTHQIRVHLAALGHPIVGDAVYGRARRHDARAQISRQALHAEQIGFRHPHTGMRVRFVAPLAADLRALWQACATRTAPRAP